MIKASIWIEVCWNTCAMYTFMLQLSELHSKSIAFLHKITTKYNVEETIS